MKTLAIGCVVLSLLVPAAAFSRGGGMGSHHSGSVTGGAFGTGSRMPIKATRALLAAALDGSLANAEMRIDPHFRFRVPVAVPGVDTKILNPRDTWADKAAYDAQAKKLVTMFRENFKKFEAHVGKDVLDAAPALAEAAE